MSTLTYVINTLVIDLMCDDFLKSIMVICGGYCTNVNIQITDIKTLQCC